MIFAHSSTQMMHAIDHMVPHRRREQTKSLAIWHAFSRLHQKHRFSFIPSGSIVELAIFHHSKLSYGFLESTHALKYLG